MKNDFYSLNDLTLLYFQDIEYLINVLNAYGISLKEENDMKYEEIMYTFHKCYEKCIELGYYESEEDFLKEEKESD